MIFWIQKKSVDRSEGRRSAIWISRQKHLTDFPTQLGAENQIKIFYWGVKFQGWPSCCPSRKPSCAWKKPASPVSHVTKALTRGKIVRRIFSEGTRILKSELFTNFMKMISSLIFERIWIFSFIDYMYSLWFHTVIFNFCFDLSTVAFFVRPSCSFMVRKG